MEVTYVVIDVDGELHVIPEEDIVEHVPRFDCICVPVLVHKQRVGRSGSERVSAWEHRALRLKENQH